MAVKRILFICALIWAGTFPPAFAATVLLEPSQDNTLYESPSGRLSNGAGNYLFAGRNLDITRRRAVIAFKDLGGIPQGATITSAKLHLVLSRENATQSIYRIHRITSDWGEGASMAAGNEGQGANSEAGDATWAHRFWPNFPWQNEGGDFVESSSAAQLIGLVGPYTFGPTVEMAEDVQLWLDNPSQNFGWIVIGVEDGAKSARRFNSRENESVATRPMLEVEYTTTGTPFDYSGPWFDPSLDGEGYLVFQTPAGWLIYYFGYSSQGTFLWLVSNLVQLDQLTWGVPFEMDMLVGEPGTFEEPTPSTELKPYGTLSVTFDSCTSGQFVLDGLDGMKTSDVVKIVGVDGTTCE
jgi:hypothetical protein